MNGFNYDGRESFGGHHSDPPVSASASASASAPGTVATLAAPNPTRKRRRPALSCAECRRRKIKCDRNIPCGQCAQSKSTTCTYTSESFTARNALNLKPSNRQLSPGAVLNTTVVDSVLKIPSLPPWPTPPVHDHLPNDNSSSSHLSYLDGRNHDRQQNSNVEDLMERIHKLERLLSASSIAERKDDPTVVSRIPAKDIRGNISKSRFFGQSHWMHAFSQVRKIMCFEFSDDGSVCVNLVDRAADTELNALMKKAKTIGRKVKEAQAPEWPFWGSDYKGFMPPREEADRLVQYYLRTYESTHRILHIPSFQKEYAQYWKSPHTAPVSSIIKILLVLAIGTCFDQESDFETVRRQAHQWIYAAQSWLSAPNEKGRLNTSMIQVQCLLLLVRSIYNVNSDLIWVTAGSVMRTAMNMGFHRDPKHFPRISILHGEVRRRLWATILELNVASALDSGMPPMISLQDFDTEAPANIDDEEISEASVNRPVSKPKGFLTQTSIQIAILSSIPISLEVTRLINDFHYEPTYDEVILLGGELMKIYKHNHQFFAQDFEATHQSQINPTALHRKLLDLKIQRTMLALHRPYAMKAKSDPRFYYSHKIYLDCALAVLAHPEQDSIMPIPRPDSGELQDDYTRVRLVSGGFLKEVMLHAAIVMYLEIIQPLEDGPSVAFSRQRKIQQAPLRRLLEDVHDISGKRIQLGETNAKGHFLFSIALAHVNALETGKFSDEAIVSVAKDALVRCCGWLEDRLSRLVDNGNGNPQQERLDIGPSAASSEWPVDDMDLSMQDWAMMDFTTTDAWLFSTWSDEFNGYE